MLHKYINKKNIAINKMQENAINNDKMLKSVVHIYSHYLSLDGIVFYCKNKRNIFLTLHHNGSYLIKDGYDGGNLSKYY